MEKSLFKYILRWSLRDQILLTAMAGMSFPFIYLSYEVPKTIVNQAIEGNDIAFPYETPVLGVELGQVGYLFLLCGIFLGLVLINQAFKYCINVYKGRTGERMLRRLRFDLYGRILRFPLPTFRKVSQGEVIPMVVAEVEPLGGFVGDAFALPAFQGGTLLTILAFLLIQDWRMALAAVALYPVQFYIIPKLQRRVRLLSKERVKRVRRISDKIGETVQGVQEIHTHDASRWVLTDFTQHLDGMFELRYRIYNLKFLIKLLNNFIQQLGPFFFFSIGGYFVIQGELEIGTLVAAIAAHKDLASPWKELLAYYEMQADIQVKYEQVINQFDPPGMREPGYQLDEPAEVPHLTGELAAANLVLNDDHGNPVIDGASFRFPLDRRVAVVGSGGGRDELALIVARLLDPDRGSLSYGGLDAARLPEAVTGRRISYVGPSAFIFAGAISDNLLFGLRHRPLSEPEYDGEAGRRRQRYVAEALRSGNLAYDPAAEWIDYESAGASGPEELRQAALVALDLVGMSDDIYNFGLRGAIDPAKRADLADAVIRARGRLREKLEADPDTAPLVETFDRARYNDNATVAENLLFGSPVGDGFDMERLAQHSYVLEVLERAGLTDQFLQMGYQVAATMVELFADLPPDHELFQQFSFISADDLPDYQALLQRADKSNLGALGADDRNRLMSLPFKLIVARHRLGVIDDGFKASIVEARAVFHDGLPEALNGAVEFFEPDRYNAAANLQDNILFGKIAYGQAQAQERVGALISEVVEELGLRNAVAEVGFGFQVGVAGSRLSGQQRQKLALARAILKRPDILVLGEATAALDTASQARIMDRLLAEFEGRALIWVVHRIDMAPRFDLVLVVRQGRVVEHGAPAELDREGTTYRQLASAG